MCNLILKYQYHIKSFVCAYLCIFSILLQLWDARLRSVVPRWHHWWSESFGFRSERRQGGRTLPCWSGQDRYCGLSSSPVWMLSCVFSVCCVCFRQAFLSPVTWSTLSASAPVRPFTTCGSNDLAPSRPGRRSTRCSASLACSARSWSSTPTWACGTAPRSPCSTTWIDRRCCCTARRGARSDTRQRSGLNTSAVSMNTAGWAAERSLPTPRWCTSCACGSPAWPWVFLLLQRSMQSWRRGQLWRLWTGWWGRPWWPNIIYPC